MTARTLGLARAAIGAVVIIAVFAAIGDAHAQTTATSRKHGGVNRIGKGVTDIGLDSLWILAYAAEEEESTFRLSLMSGPTVRYFIKPNLAVGVNISGFHKRFGEEESELGVVAMGVANYYIRLGSGMFLAPGIGAGGLYGTREQPSTPGVIQESTLVGATLSLGLPLAFYSWRMFNVRAGVNLLMTVGAATREGEDARSFVSVDGGFNVGFGYYF